MHSLRSLSFLNKPPLSLPATSLSSKTNVLTISQIRPSSFLSCVVHAAEKDSQQFDVDPDKAREALQELDQQLQSLAQKQITTPKIRGTPSLSMFFFFWSLLSWFGANDVTLMIYIYICFEIPFSVLWSICNFCFWWEVCGLRWIAWLWAAINSYQLPANMFQTSSIHGLLVWIWLLEIFKTCNCSIQHF